MEAGFEQYVAACSAWLSAASNYNYSSTPIKDANYCYIRLTLGLIAFVHADLVVKFASDLIQQLVQTRRILRHATVWIHRHCERWNCDVDNYGAKLKLNGSDTNKR